MSESEKYTLNTVVGTVYVTPDGEVGVCGYEKVSRHDRPLEHADFAAIQHLSGEIRKESASR